MPDAGGGAADPNYVSLDVGKTRLDELGIFFTRQELRDLLDEDEVVKSHLELIQGIQVAPICSAARIREFVADLSRQEDLSHYFAQTREQLTMNTVFDPRTGRQKKPSDKNVPPARIRQITNMMAREPRLQMAIMGGGAGAAVGGRPHHVGGAAVAVLPVRGAGGGKAGGAAAIMAAGGGTGTAGGGRKPQHVSDADLAEGIKAGLAERYLTLRQKNWDMPAAGALEVERRVELLLADSNSEFFFKQRRYLMGIMD